MTTHQARIVGKVEYREGDGAPMDIPPGMVSVEFTPNDATLSWADGNSRGVAAMPLIDFKRYEKEGAIAMEASTDDAVAEAKAAETPPPPAA